MLVFIADSSSIQYFNSKYYHKLYRKNPNHSPSIFGSLSFIRLTVSLNFAESDKPVGIFFIYNLLFCEFWLNVSLEQVCADKIEQCINYFNQFGLFN